MSDLNPDVDQWINQALDAYDAGDLPTAHAIAQRVLAIDTNNGEALHLLGLIHLAQNDLGRSLDLLNKAVQAQPDESEFWNTLGVALRADTELDEAADAFAKAAQLDPANAMAHFNLALAQQARQQI